MQKINYRSLTRFEINKLVAIRLGMNATKGDIPLLTDRYSELFPDTVWARPDDSAWEQFCFTNNCADWSKLLVRFSINISFDSCQVHANSYFSECNSLVSYPRKDIGKAICIAFLEMTDWMKENNIELNPYNIAL